MKVDIIIPTYKPDETLCLLLQKLQEQTFVVHRVIILNTEETLWKKALEQYPIRQALEQLGCECSLVHVKKEEFDHGGTRMLGAIESDADILIFMTQDAVFADKDTVKQLVSVLAEGEETEIKSLSSQRSEYPKERGIAIAYARQVPREDCHAVERYTRQFNYPAISRIKGKADVKELGIKTFFCSDVCAAYRRDVFLKLGGFESPIIFSEDMLFAAKAIEQDYLVAYVAEAKVFHSHNYTMKQQFHRNFDLAVSQKQHPEVFEQVSSESEGMKLVMSTVLHLFRIKKPWLSFHLGCQCIGKYAGFFMGKRYEKLSHRWILRCTGSPDYWKKVWENGAK